MIRVRWIAISFVMRQRCFPHIGMFSFLHRECINLHEGRLLRNKMHLHSTLKGRFLVLTNFDQSQELKTTAKKSLQFFAFQHVRCRCCYRSYLDRFLSGVLFLKYNIIKYNMIIILKNTLFFISPLRISIYLT